MTLNTSAVLLAAAVAVKLSAWVPAAGLLALYSVCPPKLTAKLAGALPSGWIEALAALGAKPASAEIMVRDADLAHMLRDTKTRKLPLAWLRQLPAHLRQPSAVLLDRTHAEPALLLLFDAPEGAKLVLRLDYRLKKPRGALANVLGTGALLAEKELAALRGQFGKGIEVIYGAL